MQYKGTNKNNLLNFKIKSPFSLPPCLRHNLGYEKPTNGKWTISNSLMFAQFYNIFTKKKCVQISRNNNNNKNIITTTMKNNLSCIFFLFSNNKMWPLSKSLFNRMDRVFAKNILDFHNKVVKNKNHKYLSPCC